MKLLVGRAAVLAMLLASSTPVLAQQMPSDQNELLALIRELQQRVATQDARIAQLEARISGRPSGEIPAAAQPTAPAGAASSSLAVPSIPEPNPAGRNVQREQALAQAAPSGPLDHSMHGAPSSDAASVELLAGSGGGRASFSLSHAGAQHSQGFTTDDGPAEWQTYRLTFSAPLAKTGDTTFATLDGLSTGTKLEFGWTSFSATLPTITPGQTDEEFARTTDRTAMSLTGGVGYDQFSYFDASLMKRTADRFSWSAAGAYTSFGSTNSISLGAGYERSFEAARSQTACAIVIVPSTVNCVTGALRPPASTDKIILSLEYRQGFRLGSAGILSRLGIAPRVEFDALSSDYSVDVPIFFAPNSNGQLIGGVRIGYLSNKDSVIASVFVGTTFGLNPQHH